MQHRQRPLHPEFGQVLAGCAFRMRQKNSMKATDAKVAQLCQLVRGNSFAAVFFKVCDGRRHAADKVDRFGRDHATHSEQLSKQYGYAIREPAFTVSTRKLGGRELDVMIHPAVQREEPWRFEEPVESIGEFARGGRICREVYNHEPVMAHSPIGVLSAPGNNGALQAMDCPAIPLDIEFEPSGDWQDNLVMWMTVTPAIMLVTPNLGDRQSA